MSTQFDPPRYAWTASTAREALEMLEAARDLIDAHLKTLAPNALERREASRTARVSMDLRLDLSGLVQAVNDLATLRGLEDGWPDGVPDICDCGREKQPGEDHGMCYPGME